MKIILNKMSALIEGPLGNSGKNCSKRFDLQKVKENSGTIGPLSFQLARREYPRWGVELIELRICNYWGTNLSLNELSASFLSERPANCSLPENNNKRICISDKSSESLIFFPPHYWNDGFFAYKNDLIKATLFQASKRVKPLPLSPGNERVFLILQAHKASDDKAKKVYEYLKTKKFRQLAGHKLMMSHMHTEYSDGKKTLLRNAEYIKNADIDIGLWTDHDCYLQEDDLKRVDEEIALASSENFLALMRPELSSNLWTLPDQKGKLMDHACYLTPEPRMHFGCREKDGVMCAAEGAVDIVAEEIVNKDNGVCWLAHPALSRTPEELIDGWNEYVSMMEWSNYEWIIGKNCAYWFKYCENFGDFFFYKMDMLLNAGFDVGIISGVDFHNIDNDDYVFDNGVINYLKDVQLDAESIVSCLKERRFFVSTGEVLISECELKDGEIILKVDSVFPLKNIVVATDKGKIKKAVNNSDFVGEIKIALKEIAPEKWWRTEIWDIANNPAFTQAKIIKHQELD
jgi:hypothetical protein